MGEISDYYANASMAPLGSIVLTEEEYTRAETELLTWEWWTLCYPGRTLVTQDVWKARQWLRRYSASGCVGYVNETADGGPCYRVCRIGSSSWQALENSLFYCPWDGYAITRRTYE